MFFVEVMALPEPTTTEVFQMSKNVCVIGAGVSGLCTIKELVEQNHQVTCFEGSDAIGGNFNWVNHGGKAYQSMKLTVSNYFMSYSAYPPRPDEVRDYWGIEAYLRYLNDYVEHFRLSEHIRFNRKIIGVDTSGNEPKVTVKNGDGEIETHSFDYVILCSGANAKENVPHFTGQDSFEGKIIHSSQFAKHDYKEKRVLCVGLGETGSDVSHLISQEAKHCAIAVRNLPSIVRRYIHGHPNDTSTSKILSASGKFGLDFFMKAQAYLKLKLDRNMAEKDRIYFEMLRDQTTGFSDRFLTKNDVFIEDIAAGKLEVKVAQIKNIQGNVVHFSDGSSGEFDFIVCNTGYLNEFSFVDQGAYLSNPRDSLKHMLHPKLQHQLAMVGWARPTQGGVPVSSEMQARYIALLLSNKKAWLNEAEAGAIIKQDRHYEAALFKGSAGLKSLVDYHQYMRSMAELIGCQPKQLSWVQPKLFFKYWYGSHLSHFYRLSGPGENERLMKRVIHSLPITQTLRRSVILTVLSAINFVYERGKSGLSLITTPEQTVRRLLTRIRASSP